jgi:hypothetical protein
MEVNIYDGAFEWQSDYDIGWLFSSGDDYKFPVVIGEKHACFIKRFARNPERVSGWRLVQALRATKQPGLPRIHDIVQTEESDTRVRYLFYECMEGGTLDELIRKGWAPDPGRLLADLFKGLVSIHRHEHWMSDFCEKNIFCKRDDTYCLIDLDSAHPVSARPDNEMFGNKELWALAFSYLNQQLDLDHIRPADLPGPVLNYLQAALLVLRVKVALVDRKEEYKSTAFRDRLPALLDAAVPEFRELFTEIVRSGVLVPPEEDIERIKELLVRRVVHGDAVPKPERGPIGVGGMGTGGGGMGIGGGGAGMGGDRGGGEIKAPPVVRSFTCDKKRLWKGGAFTLSWEVSDGDKVTVCRNGLPYKAAAKGLGAITLTERYDGKEKKIVFTLMATNEKGVVNSEPLLVHVGPIAVRPYLLAAAGVVVLGLMVLLVVEVVRHVWRGPSPKMANNLVRVDTASSARAIVPVIDAERVEQDRLNQAREEIRLRSQTDSAKVARDRQQVAQERSQSRSRSAANGNAVARPVVHDSTPGPTAAELEAMRRVEAERELKRVRLLVQRRVMEDSVRVVDTVLSHRRLVVFHAGQRVLGIDNRSGFFLDTVVVEITPGGGGKPYKKDFYNVKAKSFSVLMSSVPKEGVKASVLSVIF